MGHPVIFIRKRLISRNFQSNFQAHHTQCVEKCCKKRSREKIFREINSLLTYLLFGEYVEICCKSLKTCVTLNVILLYSKLIWRNIFAAVKFSLLTPTLCWKTRKSLTKNISSNQLFSKTVTFTKFLPKMRERKLS